MIYYCLLLCYVFTTYPCYLKSSIALLNVPNYGTDILYLLPCCMYLLLCYMCKFMVQMLCYMFMVMVQIFFIYCSNIFSWLKCRYSLSTERICSWLWCRYSLSIALLYVVVVVVLLLNVHGQQLRSCWDGQLT